MISAYPLHASLRYCIRRSMMVLWLTALSYGACSAWASVPTEAGSPAWAVVKDYMRAWNEHDADAAVQVLDEHITYFNTSNPAVKHGPDAVAQVRKIVESLFGMMPDLHWQMIGMPVIQDDRVAFEWEISGNAQVPAKRYEAASTRPLRLRGVSVARVDDGKIIYFSDYYNALSVQQQLAD